MRIFHVAESLPGGIATYLRELLPQQCAQFGQGQVHVLAPAEHIDHLGALPGLEIHHFRHPGSRLWATLTLILQTRIAIRRIRPDVVHAHSTFAGVAVRICGLLLRQRPAIVYCAHGWAFKRDVAAWKNSLAAICERVLASACEAISSISRAEHEAALRAGLPERRCRVIRNAVSPATLGGPGAVAVDPSRLNFLFLGRHDHQKGLDIALRVFAELPAERFCLYIAGSKVLSSTRNSEAVVPAGVRQLGWIAPEHIDACIRSFDALLVPSRWEGFGLVVLEAMRNDVAVIASNRGSLPELVIDGHNGRIFDLDRPGALPELLRSLDRQALARMGAAGRRRFEDEFSTRRMYEETTAMYRDAIRMRGNRRMADDSRAGSA